MQTAPGGTWARRWAPLILVAVLLFAIVVGALWAQQNEQQHARDDVCELQGLC
ncbi:MAG: hypothetical protein JWM89_1551 [Acidimicrobiales bacterium]|nr:hypothetical protein [Acidimicrobiales bacterium]